MSERTGFGRRVDGPTGRRHAVRERLNLAVSLYSVEQTRVAVLADISEEGCKLQGLALPGVGRDVLLKAGDVELFGQIVWKSNGERGVKFDHALTDASLAELRSLLALQLGQNKHDPEILDPRGRRRSR